MEQWKDIKGYEEFYQVSNMGNVRSKPRKKWNGKVFYTLPERTLNQSENGDGYNLVHLYKPDTKRRTVKVGRLVSDHFMTPSQDPEKNYITRKNGVRNDNRLENLEWCSSSEIITKQHIEKGTYSGEYAGRKKLYKEKNA